MELEGEAMLQAAGFDVPFGPNPDAEFVRAVAPRGPATPDVATALRAHQVADAAYRSAAAAGAPVPIP